MQVTFEICVEEPTEVQHAVDLGASRIELCRDLANDGLTPSLTDLAVALNHKPRVPVFVLVRCRPGDFCFSSAEKVEMLEHVRALVAAGADGVVSGGLTPDGKIDTEFCSALVAASSSRPVTFHKAFDSCSEDVNTAMEKLRVCGVTRVLSSGQAPTAAEGMDTLRRMVEIGNPKAVVAGGVRAHNFNQLHSVIGADEYHGRDPTLGLCRTTGQPVPAKSTRWSVLS